MDLTRPHEPTDACADDHCYGHDVDEPIPFGPLLEGALTCGECFHFYPSGAALEADYRAAVAAMPAHYREGDVPPERTADEIHFCQHCLHDF